METLLRSLMSESRKINPDGGKTVAQTVALSVSKREYGSGSPKRTDCSIDSFSSHQASGTL